MTERRSIRMAVAGLGSAALLAGWAAWGPELTAATLPSAPAELAALAVSEDPQLAAAATTRLRTMGPEGLEAMLSAHAEAVAAMRDGRADRDDPRIVRLRSAIDSIAAQRDAHASGLYWYTDIELAKAEARRQGKPILSLRLLGRLDEELSCANSRLFRTVLYPDPRVAARLERRFVLHWSSERPVPLITIDMRDGRALTRTITGNSVHYVLDARGRPVDAIPGLYGPRAFLRALAGAEAIAKRCGRDEGAAHRTCLAEAHAAALAKQQRAWDEIRAAWTIGLAPPANLGSLTLAPLTATDRPAAIVVDRLTISKSRMERPMLRAMQPPMLRAVQLTPEPAIPRIAWWTVAGPLFARGDRLSPRALALARWKAPDADHAAMVAWLGRSLAEDTVRNELVLHRRAHARFTTTAPVSFDALNTWVYATLFLTPATDPWLGLRDPAVYDAIER